MSKNSKNTIMKLMYPNIFRSEPELKNQEIESKIFESNYLNTEKRDK